MADPVPESGANENLNSIMAAIPGCKEEDLAKFLLKLLDPELKKEGEVQDGLKDQVVDSIVGSKLEGDIKIDSLYRICENFGYSGRAGKSLFELLIENGRFEDAALLISQQKIKGATSEDVDRIDLTRLGMGIKRELLVAISEDGIFNEKLLESTISGSEDSPETGEILRNLFKSGKFREIREIAVRDEAIIRSRHNFMVCINSFINSDDWGSALTSLKEYRAGYIENLDEFRKLSAVLLENDETDLAGEFILSGLKAFPDDFELLRLRVEYLIRKGDNHEAFTVLQDLFERGTLDNVWKLKTVRMALDLGLYEDCVRLVSRIDQQDRTLDIRKFEIESLLKLGRFDEASKAIAECERKSPESEEITYLKYQLMRSLQKQNEAYDLAVELIKMGSRIDDVITYLFEWLYSLGEFKDIIETYRKFELDGDMYLPYVVSSMISTRDFRSAMEIAESKPDVLYAYPVLDSIFYYARNEETAKKLEALLIPENVGLKMIIQKIRGLPNLKIPDVPDPGVMRSKALSFIISFPHYNSNERDVDERIKTILSSGKNAEIRELLDVVYQARTEGKMPSGFADSPRFMFPVTLALADGGYFETAENLVMRSEHAEADPFYNFIRHRIEFGRKNYGLSKKFLSRAMHSLTNFQFLQDSVFLGLLTEDGGMLDSLNSIEQNGWAPYFSTERLYRTVKESGKWGSIVTILDKLTSWGVTNHYSLRLSRDYLISKGDLKGALASSASIFRIPGYSIDDVKIHLDILDRNGNGMDKYPFLDDVEADHMVPYAHVIHGDLLFSQGKMHDAIIHYDLAAKAGIDLKGNRNFATALIDSGRENEAVDLLGKIDDPYLLIRVYHKQHKIQESIQILRKYAESAGDYTELYTFAAQNLWYNRDVRDTLMEIFNEHGHLFLGKIIARNLFEQGESESAVRILGNISKNYPQNLEIKRILIDTMVKGGMRDEAIALILNNLPQFKDYREQMDLIRTLYYLYFQDRDYEAVTKFYQTNPDYIDSEILQYIVRSYIELEDFDTAERVISRYEGTALPRDMHSELMENLNFKKEFVETMFFVSKLFKAEYKEGKTFDRKEAFYKAGIPVEKLPEVYSFLESRDFYHDVNPEKYEIFSRDVIQRSVKACKLESIRELQMNVIYNNLDRRDPVIARNLYIYIKEQLETLRKPRYKDAHFLKLLKSMLKEEIKPEPLHVAYGLKVGISEALDVLAIYHHIDHVQDQKGV